MTMPEFISQAAAIWMKREHWRMRCEWEYRQYQHVRFGEFTTMVKEDFLREATHSYCLMLRCDGDIQRLQEQYETEHGDQ